MRIERHNSYGATLHSFPELFAGLNRCGKSCRLRWTNYLRPDLKHGSFTPQEEELIINLHEAIGSRYVLHLHSEIFLYRLSAMYETNMKGDTN